MATILDRKNMWQLKFLSNVFHQTAFYDPTTAKNVFLNTIQNNIHSHLFLQISLETIYFRLWTNRKSTKLRHADFNGATSGHYSGGLSNSR